MLAVAIARSSPSWHRRLRRRRSLDRAQIRKARAAGRRPPLASLVRLASHHSAPAYRELTDRQLRMGGKRAAWKKQDQRQGQEKWEEKWSSSGPPWHVWRGACCRTIRRGHTSLQLVRRGTSWYSVPGHRPRRLDERGPEVPFGGPTSGHQSPETRRRESHEGSDIGELGTGSQREVPAPEKTVRRGFGPHRRGHNQYHTRGTKGGSDGARFGCSWHGCKATTAACRGRSTLGLHGRRARGCDNGVGFHEGCPFGCSSSWCACAAADRSVGHSGRCSASARTGHAIHAGDGSWIGNCSRCSCCTGSTRRSCAIYGAAGFWRHHRNMDIHSQYLDQIWKDTLRSPLRLWRAIQVRGHLTRVRQIIVSIS